MSDTCQLEHLRVEIYEKWIGFHSGLWWDFHMEELDLKHEVHEACPVIEFETPPECAEARGKLQQHRFWKMEPLERTIDALREKLYEHQEALENCEHEAKAFKLA
ncbi:hypothetical protein [Ruegeria atlantica]|uniref:hypothetical protein n=1 Tax=Ruegeria atlantica TaxID=81569 RepID=UPI002494C559|nr:hypothetical protein [Ruegeria atlantica]